MSESTPSGWVSVQLSDVVPNVQYGVSVSLDDNEGIPVLRMNNMREGSIDIGEIKRSSSPEAARLLLQPNDVLFNRTNSIEHVGRTSLWRGELERASFASYIVRLFPDSSRLDAEYLVRWLNLPDIQLAIRRFATPGVHQVNINPTNLRRVKIRLPNNLCEQQRIAEILSTVDQAIEGTEALVGKLKQMKAGLMHDLFTRGVTPDGQLRPTQQEAPHLYQNSPLGWIPKEWEYSNVGDVIAGIEQGWSPDCESEPAQNHEWGVLKTSAVVWGGYDPSENKRLPSHLSPLASLRVIKGDILMTRAGPNSRVGVVCLVDEDAGNLMLSDKLYRLVPKAGLAPEFLALALSSALTQTDLSRFKTGLAESQTNISQAIVRRLLVPVPNESERTVICDRINAVRENLSAALTDVAKLRQQKQGLMHDLLTGRVRVKPATTGN